MQTASKVDLNDNWKDIGLNLMNIRPLGTYTKPHCCKPHRPHCPAPVLHPHECPYPCPAPQHIDPHKPHHCHPHTWPIDIDGDGFVEGDVITKPLIPFCEPPIPPVKPDHETDPDFTVDEDENITDTDDTKTDTDSSSDDTNDNEAETTEIVEETKTIYGVEHEEDNWVPSEVINTETNTVVAESPVEFEEYKEIEEPIIKPTRTRRVNRGGRRKKDI